MWNRKYITVEDEMAPIGCSMQSRITLLPADVLVYCRFFWPDFLEIAAVRTRLTCCFKQLQLNSDEAVEFLRYRLEIAQAEPNIFEQEALVCIAVDTKGNRRLMMNPAAMCMEKAARRNDKIITAELATSVNTEIML
ncbi:MAG: hypothetical protein GF398_12325 [Chitinivibrionales bacterium]|nr:hypothetical protein [Chitinivibrionales bacterium]